MFEGPNVLLKKIKGERVLVSKRLELDYEAVSTAATVLSVEKPISYMSSAGAIAMTLPVGYEGQIKILKTIGTVAGAITVTPSTLEGGGTIVFTATAKQWIGICHAGTWYLLYSTL